jgi:hypothetical protein
MQGTATLAEFKSLPNARTQFIMPIVNCGGLGMALRIDGDRASLLGTHDSFSRSLTDSTVRERRPPIIVSVSDWFALNVWVNAPNFLFAKLLFPVTVC